MSNLNLKESINHCMELINVNHPIALWTYQKDLSLAEEQLTDFQPVRDILGIFELKKHITKERILRGDPIILENRFGMMIIICFSRKGSRIVAAGPAYAGPQDPRDMRKRMEESGMNVTEINAVVRNLRDLPVISYIQLVQVALMLHYCLNHEKLDQDRVRFFATVSDNESKERNPKEDDLHPGIYESEQKLVSMVKQGSVNAISMARQMAGISGGIRMDTKDSLRKAKDNFIVLLTIVSRSAMEGGLSPSVAYSLNDQYGTMIEKQKSLSDISDLCEKMLTDYVMRLRRQRQQNGISSQVQEVCEWILMHLEKDLSIQQIADREGYTPYYFSRLFKKEMGISLTAWIRRQKIQRAKVLLRNTDLSIDDINARLHFGSREYFSSSFHKETGVSPTEFRKYKKVSADKE